VVDPALEPGRFRICARLGALGVLVGLLMAVGLPPGQARRWHVRVPAGAGGAAVGDHLP
jgi:hypothetical protein